jgi:iron complex outermembrane receptor protein
MLGKPGDASETRHAQGLRAGQIVLAVASLIGGLQAAHAAEQDNTTLPPVVITAQRIPALASTTPVSVGVISQDDIEKKGFFQLNDLVGVIAGVTVPNGYSNMPQAVGIRGVGVSQPAMAQAVGIYVDDVPLLRGYATALWDLPDIVRYEVLRGPQGTLYGQNSTAGAVKVVSEDPDKIAGSWFSVGAGNRGHRELRGLFAGQIQQGLSASLALSSRKNDGFAYNAVRDEGINRLDASQFRAKVKLAAGPSGHLVLAVDGLLDRSDTNTTNFPLNHAGAAPRVSFNANDAGAFKRKAGGASATVEWNLDADTRLRSISAYRGYTDDPTDADWGGLEVTRYRLQQVVRQRTASQELQLSHRRQNLDLVAGVMLINDRFYFNRYTTSAPPALASPVYSQATTRQKMDDVGLYAQAHLRLSDKLSATLGLRAYRTEQDASNAFWRTDANRVPTQQVYNAPSLHTSENGVLPRLGLDYTVSPTTFLYASMAQGEKFAGFNRAAESAPSAQVAAQPEKVTTYELGAKYRSTPNRLTVSAAAFYNDYKDYLASVTNTTINGVLVSDAVFLNAGKAKTYGIDLDAEQRFSANFSATASVEWLRTRFLSFVNPTGSAALNFAGHELPNAPRLSASLGLRGQFDAPGGTVSSDAWLQHLSKQYIDAANTQVLRVPNQTYLNFAVAYTQNGGPWQLSLRVRNAADKANVLVRTSIPPLGIDTAYYNAPRTIMLNVRYEL